MTNASIYETGMEPNEANFVPLSPISLLKRTAKVHPERVAVIHGELQRTWAETCIRCKKLASALHRLGIAKGDTVSVMAPNVPEFVEASFGIPMCGAIINSLNIRLDAEALAFILTHCEAKVLLSDTQFSAVIKEALKLVKHTITVIDIDDPLNEVGECIAEMDYEAFLATGDENFPYMLPDNEWQAIALNYTSGTTGDPKGVVYSHRGAYLNAIGNSVTWELGHFPRYLWTLPMFHCNGWCFPWTITALAGTHVCLRKIEGHGILSSIQKNQVSHLCGAPIVMSMIIKAQEESQYALPGKVRMMTAGAAPPSSVMAKMEQLGFDIIHVYGLTEVYGPAVVCAWKPEWDKLPQQEREHLKARQGVPYELEEDLMVADPDTLAQVAHDGESIGEIMIRGNIVMKGYLKNPETTKASFAGGWFHTGDLAVMHPDGYIEIKDRSKDIIISGGENISSIEVEDTLYKFPGVSSAAVVAKADEKWGEVPCAFIEMSQNQQASSEDIIAFCRNNLARFKCPKHVVFGPLPKTVTGKIQKFLLREKAEQI